MSHPRTKSHNRPTIYIQGDPISAEELDRQLIARRISHYRFNLETLRVSDLSPEEKSARMHSLAWEIAKLENKTLQRG